MCVWDVLREVNVSSKWTVVATELMKSNLTGSSLQMQEKEI